jgi:hypothetical protein
MFGRSRGKKLVPGAAAIASVAIPIIVGILNAHAIRAQNATDWQTRAGGKMAFDVASIKLSKGAFVPSNPPLTPWDDDIATNSRFRADAALSTYIEFAYKVWGNEVQSREFTHLAKWVNTDRYICHMARPACAAVSRQKSGLE